MDKICLLKEPYNHCIYHSEIHRCLAKSTVCGMQIKLDDSGKKNYEYKREPRWYEKYYQPRQSENGTAKECRSM